jgi:hypothetical protein
VHPWTSFWGVFHSAHNLSLKLGKSMIVGEYGSVEQTACGNGTGDPNAKAQWLTGAGQTLQAWPNVKVAMYSHTLGNFEGFPEAYWVDTSAQSLAAYSAVGNHPYFA